LQQEPVRPLWALVLAQNRASIRVLEKCGFSRVGDGEVGAEGVEEWLFQRVS
jgi:RimJ/RimL family protein N-acetyltransferase